MNDLRTETILVKGMYCTNCERKVQEALLSLPGVQSADVSFAEETVTVIYDGTQVSSHLMKQEIEKIGYVKGNCVRTDWFIRDLYQPKGCFTSHTRQKRACKNDFQACIEQQKLLQSKALRVSAASNEPFRQKMRMQVICMDFE